MRRASRVRYDGLGTGVSTSCDGTPQRSQPWMRRRATLEGRLARETPELVELREALRVEPIQHQTEPPGAHKSTSASSRPAGAPQGLRQRWARRSSESVGRTRRAPHSSGRSARAEFPRRRARPRAASVTPSPSTPQSHGAPPPRRPASGVASICSSIADPPTPELTKSCPRRTIARFSANFARKREDIPLVAASTRLEPFCLR